MRTGKWLYRIFRKILTLISFDLKSGYHYIDIHPDYQKFLVFAWKRSNETPFRYFVFIVLSFGLASAPHVLTRCLKPI